MLDGDGDSGGQWQSRHWGYVIVTVVAAVALLGMYLTG